MNSLEDELIDKDFKLRRSASKNINGLWFKILLVPIFFICLLAEILNSYYPNMVSGFFVVVAFTFLVFLFIFLGTRNYKRLYRKYVREELNKRVKNVEELITKYIWLNSIRAGNLDKEKSEIEKNVIKELRFLCNSNELDFLALEEYVKNAKNATNDSFIKHIIKLVNIFENIKKESGNNIKNVLDF